MKAVIAVLAVALLAPEACTHRLSSLPDERPKIPTEKDIAVLEAARAEAAKVKKNPQQALLD